MNQELPHTFNQQRKLLDDILRVESSFDMLARPLEIAGKEARLYYINGFIRSEIMEEVIAFLLRMPDDQAGKTAAEFIRRNISNIDAQQETDCDKIVTGVLSGKLCLISEAFYRCGD